MNDVAPDSGPRLTRGSGDGFADRLNDLLSIVVPYAVMISIVALPLIAMGRGFTSTGDALGLFDSQAFDEDAWHAGNRVVRGKLAKDLERSGVLIGLDEDELIDVLGDPDEHGWDVICWLDSKYGRMTRLEAAWQEGDERAIAHLYIGNVLCTSQHLAEQRGLSLVEVAERPSFELPSSGTWNEWTAGQRTQCLADLAMALRVGALSVVKLVEWEIADRQVDTRLRYELDEDPHAWLEVVLSDGLVDSVSVFTRHRDYSAW